MPLFYHKYVNYVLAHSVNYVITLYSLPLPLHRILPPSQPLQKDNNPSPRTTTLASPRKRGGGTADIIFWLAVQYSDSPTFTILKLFRAVTVGIVNASEAFMLALLSISIPFDPHQPFQNRTIPRSAPHSCLPCQR